MNDQKIWLGFENLTRQSIAKPLPNPDLMLKTISLGGDGRLNPASLGALIIRATAK